MSVEEVIGSVVKLRRKVTEFCGKNYDSYSTVGADLKRIDKIVRKSGHSEFRIRIPGSMITADYREDRLNFVGKIQNVDDSSAEFLITGVEYG